MAHESTKSTLDTNKNIAERKMRRILFSRRTKILEDMTIVQAIHEKIGQCERDAIFKLQVSTTTASPKWILLSHIKEKVRFKIQ